MWTWLFQTFKFRHVGDMSRVYETRDTSLSPADLYIYVRHLIM